MPCSQAQPSTLCEAGRAVGRGGAARVLACVPRPLLLCVFVRVLRLITRSPCASHRTPRFLFRSAFRFCCRQERHGQQTATQRTGCSRRRSVPCGNGWETRRTSATKSRKGDGSLSEGRAVRDGSPTVSRRRRAGAIRGHARCRAPRIRRRIPLHPVTSRYIPLHSVA